MIRTRDGVCAAAALIGTAANRGTQSDGGGMEGGPVSSELIMDFGVLSHFVPKASVNSLDGGISSSSSTHLT